MTDNFFAPLENTKPYLKIAFEGFAGSGKTYTAAQVAAGLHARIGSKKPIVIFDTEHAAKFLKRFFAEKGIAVLHKESRSLADLKETQKRLREGVSDILLIDSITHVWEDFLRAYKANKKKNKDRLEFQDWGILKPLWKQEFSEPFVLDPYHSIMTGRAAFEYEDEKDENGNRQIYKAGIKMRVEGETAYEPDLLVLMSRFEEILTAAKDVWREATLIKDRSTLIDGKTFRNPTYADFAPAVDYILEDPRPREIRETDAATLLPTEDNSHARAREREILFEKIEAYCVKVGLAGQSAEAKKSKVLAFEKAFGTASWTAIKGLPHAVLTEGLEDLRKWVDARDSVGAQNGDTKKETVKEVTS